MICATPPSLEASTPTKRPLLSRSDPQVKKLIVDHIRNVHDIDITPFIGQRNYSDVVKELCDNKQLKHSVRYTKRNIQTNREKFALPKEIQVFTRLEFMEYKHKNSNRLPYAVEDKDNSRTIGYIKVNHKDIQERGKRHITVRQLGQGFLPATKVHLRQALESLIEDSLDHHRNGTEPKHILSFTATDNLPIMTMSAHEWSKYVQTAYNIGRREGVHSTGDQAANQINQAANQVVRYNQEREADVVADIPQLERLEVDTCIADTNHVSSRSQRYPQQNDHSICDVGEREADEVADIPQLDRLEVDTCNADTSHLSSRSQRSFDVGEREADVVDVTAQVQKSDQLEGSRAYPEVGRDVADIDTVDTRFNTRGVSDGEEKNEAVNSCVVC